MTEVKSALKVEEVTICETGQLKKGVSVWLPSKVSQGTGMSFLQELLCSSTPYIHFGAKEVWLYYKHLVTIIKQKSRSVG